MRMLNRILGAFPYLGIWGFLGDQSLEFWFRCSLLGFTAAGFLALVLSVGLGLRAWSLEIRVWGFRVPGLETRVRG